MSRGAGRLERAILEVLSRWGSSTDEICRAAYSETTLIEKKHRVAVLQAIHRIMNNRPRPTEDRDWTIEQGPKRGHWRRAWPPHLQLPPEAIRIAYHEAGHALVELYFGWPIDRVTVHTNGQIDKQILARGRAAKRGILPNDLVGGFVRRVTYLGDNLGVRSHLGTSLRLMVLVAGSIAEAHFKGKWPLRSRGVSQTYEQFFGDGGQSDQEKINAILADLSDDPADHDIIRRRAQALAQALIRSAPGWRFIQLLAEKMVTLKHGSLKHHSVAAIFRQAFGRPPPEPTAWNDHWPPTLQRVRVGWLPPT